MINYRRRKRQANENSKILIERFYQEISTRKILYPGIFNISTEKELIDVLKKLQKDVRLRAGKIAPDWSIPIILESIGKLYYGDQSKFVYYGPIFKRALVYLWDVERFNNGEKNIESILEVLRLCFIIEELYGLRRFFLIDNEFSFTMKGGYFTLNEKHISIEREFASLIQGRGKRMRIAEENSRLMCSNILEFVNALCCVLYGDNPNDVPFFKGTFYEKIPGIDNIECKKFWQGIYIRYMLFVNMSMEQMSENKEEENLNPVVNIFPELSIEMPEGLCTQEIIYDIFWNKTWLEKQDDERYSNLVVERPVLRITEDGDYATCSALIADSINRFIEDQIMDYPFRSPKINLPARVFKDVISGPFEDKVIHEFREKGFWAGHVSESGVWKIQDLSINLKGTSTTLYGEIDALAYMQELNLAILVECKVLNDIRDYRSFKNIISKLVDDNEGFQAKIEKKGNWVNEALSEYFQVKVSAIYVLLTDIPLPIINFPNDNIFFSHYDKFFRVLEHLLISAYKLLS